MPDQPQDIKPTEDLESPLHLLLQTKLQRLLRVKEELRDECQPVPPELEKLIQEVRESLGMN
jgi:hypothetical protein